MMGSKIQTPDLAAIPPFSHHAITFHMPGWEYVLQFVERDPELMKRFEVFYPRMLLHGDVKKLSKVILERVGGEGGMCLLFGDGESAKACVALATVPIKPAPTVTKRPPAVPLDPSDISIRLFTVNKIFIYAVIFPAVNFQNAMPFWNMSGTGISSRLAEDALKDVSLLQEHPLTTPQPQPIDSPSHILIRQRISSLLQNLSPSPNSPSIRKQVESSDIYLYQTGMTTIYQLHNYLSKLYPSHTPILFGFAFHDTSRVFNSFNNKTIKEFPRGDAADLLALEAYLESNINTPEKVRALYTEFPANPLLHSASISTLRRLSSKYNFLLIVDDTIGSFSNLDLLNPLGADILVSSLTKSFSGYADVMSGSIILNPNRDSYPSLKSLLDKEYKNWFYERDAQVLESNSRDYISRSKILNRNALAIVEYLTTLSTQPDSSIKQIFYPTTSPTRANYEEFMRAPTPSEDFEAGYGCLFSVELVDVEATKAFYEALNVHIGPHLGAHLTLAFAYNKIVFGKELDTDEGLGRAGMKETQIRVSVGLEEVEGLKRVFGEAVGKADLVSKGRKS